MLGPAIVGLLVVELLVTAMELDGVTVVMLVIAALGALSPRWFQHAAEIRPARPGLHEDDNDEGPQRTRRALSWMGILLGAVAVSRAGATAEHNAGSMWLELAGSVAAPWVGALMLELALTVPDDLPRLSRALKVALRVFAWGGALALSILEALRTSPGLDVGSELFIVPHQAGWITAVFVVTTVLIAIVLRASRRTLGSTPEHLAQNAWALFGLAVALLAGALAVLVLVIGDPLHARGSEASPVLRGLVALALASALIGHIAMTENVTPSRSAATLRTLLAGLLALVAGGAVAVLFRGTDRTWLHASVRGIGVVLTTAGVYTFLRAFFDRAIVPDGRRLLDAIDLIHEKLGGARTLGELGEVVLPPFRKAARSAEALPMLLTFDPPRECVLDAASLAHIEKREPSPAILQRLEAHPHEVLVAAPVLASVVRKPESRVLAEVLTRMDTLAVLPLGTEGVEGALIIPRGARKHSVTLEEIAALGSLARALAPRVASWAAEARASERVGRAHIEKAVLEERIAFLEDELADRGTTKLPESASARATGAIAYAVASQQARKFALEAASRDTPLFLDIETGTPVEPWVSRIHEEGPRREQPITWVRCASLDPAHIEEHLFGKEGGDESDVGALRSTGRGTLALIDMPALPLAVQARLAESIATRALLRGTALYPFHARIVMTATRPLTLSEDESESTMLPIDGELQKRLASQSIRIPRLHERLEDLPSLALLAIDRACRSQGIPALGLSEDALQWLTQHAVFDGEAGLERVLMRAVRRAKPPRVQAHDLEQLTTPRPLGEDPLDATLAEIEERALLRALQRAGGNKSEAARMLGLKRTTFLDKLRRFGLDDGSERPSA